jgi:hypothetical protein
VNLEKHVKRPVEQWMFADSSLVPSHTRSAHIIGHYIKDKKMRYARSYPNAVRRVPLLVRLEGLPTDDATRERIERQIREANRQWRLANAHIRARMV